jgi:hypothetical protein
LCHRGCSPGYRLDIFLCNRGLSAPMLAPEIIRNPMGKPITFLDSLFLHRMTPFFSSKALLFPPTLRQRTRRSDTKRVMHVFLRFFGTFFHSVHLKLFPAVTCRQTPTTV